MVASIFGERFVGKREPAWHGLGQVFTDDPSASEALKRGGMDYRIEKVETFFKWGDQLIASPRAALVREPVPGDPNPTLLGFAGEKYSFLQNSDIAQLLDGLTTEWPVETIGALGSGETIFFTLKVGGGEIAGDEMQEFFLVSDTRDGKHALKIVYTPIRVVCQNTLITAMNAATLYEAIAHNATQKDDVKLQIGLMAKMKASRDLVNKALTDMSAKVLTPEQIETVIAQTYPLMTLPKKIAKAEERRQGDPDLFSEAELESLKKLKGKYQNELQGIENKRVGARTLLEKWNDEHGKGKYANTAWAVYNAIVETEDYRKGNNEKEDGAASVSRSALFGQRATAKQDAFKALAEICGIGLNRQVEVTFEEKKPKVKAVAAAKPAKQPKKSKVLAPIAPVAADEDEVVGADSDVIEGVADETEE